MRRIGLAAAVWCLAAMPAAAETVTVLVGELPPHAFPDATGREIELLDDVFARCGWTAAYRVEPFTRHWVSFERGSGDAVATVPIGMTLGGTQTEPYIRYQNGVSVLAASGLTPGGLDDLAGRDAVAFAGAAEIIPELAGRTGIFSSYREIADQLIHSRLLYSGRVDAVLGEGMIFAEYNRELAEDPSDLRFDPNQAVSFFPIFESTPYAAVFRDAERAAAFDRCLAESIAAGVPDQVTQTYADRYRSVVGDAYDAPVRD
jgi:ABC-type amino acid transport substrate-binding protein